MIVQEPPYDLVALFSDLEMQRLFEAWLERGQEARRRCAREFRWRSLRDPRRDTVWSQPERALQPFFQFGCRFLIVWDHHGTGLEASAPGDVEAQVVQRLTRVDVPVDRILAVALEPELERLLVPIWQKVKVLMSEERAMDPPEDAAILIKAKEISKAVRSASDFDDLLVRNPKEVFVALVQLVRLRRAAPLYEKIGAHTSLPTVKRDGTAGRIASTLRDWFPREPRQSQPDGG
jgi:hypothetical protein